MAPCVSGVVLNELGQKSSLSVKGKGLRGSPSHIAKGIISVRFKLYRCSLPPVEKSVFLILFLIVSKIKLKNLLPPSWKISGGKFSQQKNSSY